MAVVTTKRGKRRALPDWAVIKLKPYVRCAGGKTATGEVCGLPEGEKTVLRKEHTLATSGKLLAFRECIKRARAGKTYANVEESRKAFREAAKMCSEELKTGRAARVPRVPRARRRFPLLEEEEEVEF